MFKKIIVLAIAAAAVAGVYAITEPASVNTAQGSAQALAG